MDWNFLSGLLWPVSKEGTNAPFPQVFWPNTLPLLKSWVKPRIKYLEWKIKVQHLLSHGILLEVLPNPACHPESKEDVVKVVQSPPQAPQGRGRAVRERGCWPWGAGLGSITQGFVSSTSFLSILVYSFFSLSIKEFHIDMSPMVRIWVVSTKNRMRSVSPKLKITFPKTFGQIQGRT